MVIAKSLFSFIVVDDNVYKDMLKKNPSRRQEVAAMLKVDETKIEEEMDKKFENPGFWEKLDKIYRELRIEK